MTKAIYLIPSSQQPVPTSASSAHRDSGRPSTSGEWREQPRHTSASLWDDVEEYRVINKMLDFFSRKHIGSQTCPLNYRGRIPLCPPVPMVRAPVPMVSAPVPMVRATVPMVRAPLPMVRAPLPMVRGAKVAAAASLRRPTVSGRRSSTSE